MRRQISGSMFTMYRAGGARLLRACVQLSLDRNADALRSALRSAGHNSVA